ncbi:MAG: hypothetical protein H6732_00040 [Alphaproteobacteria bacterium]|nr:hypothetical protein [Alphaproteobacteria bacterium]
MSLTVGTLAFGAAWVLYRTLQAALGDPGSPAPPLADDLVRVLLMGPLLGLAAWRARP